MKRLYCIPGGGMTSILFIQWQKKLGPDIKVEYLDIPGRGYLSKKPEQQDMNGIAEVLAAEIMAKSADEPYLIFGYCFGAVAAYEVCMKLEEKGFHRPEKVFVCGSYPPSPREKVTEMVSRKHMRDELQRMFYHMFPSYLFKDADMQKKVSSAYMKALYGIYDSTGKVSEVSSDDNAFSELIAADAETGKYVVKLANDYFRQYVKDEKILIEYCNSEKPLKKIMAPLTVIFGRDDDVIGDEWKVWENFAGDSFDPVSIPTDHFSLTDDMEMILGIVTNNNPERER